MKEESLVLLHVRKSWGESLDFATFMNVESNKRIGDGEDF